LSDRQRSCGTKMKVSMRTRQRQRIAAPVERSSRVPPRQWHPEAPVRREAKVAEQPGRLIGGRKVAFCQFARKVLRTPRGGNR